MLYWRCKVENKDNNVEHVNFYESCNSEFEMNLKDISDLYEDLGSDVWYEK